MKRILGLLLISAALAGCVTSKEVVIGKDSDGNDIVKDVGKIDYEKASIARLRLANAYIAQKDMTRAKENLEIAQNYDPDSELLFLSWGNYYETVKDTEKAREIYEKSYSKFSSSGTTLTQYANFLCKCHELEKAQELFEKAVAIPKYADIGYTYASAARCAADHDQHDKAGEYFEKAKQYGGSDPDTLYSYALWTYSQNQCTKAHDLIHTFGLFVKEASPQVLALKIKIEKCLKNYDEASELGLSLTRRFPRSQEAKDYIKGKF